MTLKVKVYAAGSLRKVLPVLFEQAGIEAEIEFGPSGVLKDRIAGGESVDLFFSANKMHGSSLAASGLSSEPIAFAHNELCLFGRSDVIGNRNPLQVMLDEQVRLGTSTPIDDPGGDYAFMAFDKAEMLQSGATAALKNKALPLVGGKNSKIRDGSNSPVHVLFEKSLVDVFLGYKTTAQAVKSGIDGIEIVELSAKMQVQAEYTVVVIRESAQGALALDLLGSEESRNLLVSEGFSN
ncbi:substrate-binding domain-containing protein [Maridesulfovibrio sp.]|uniref:substrate-binding domain-containing protein n=1 Tax=Maridesulfovibrio sp. TaxID=2795000 RepID=UPI002A189EEE|nr:substrate-binding domain-containing protein [Maridesulfovibrio sp.]